MNDLGLIAVPKTSGIFIMPSCSSSYCRWLADTNHHISSVPINGLGVSLWDEISYIYITSYSLIQYFWIVTIVIINQPQCNNMLGVNLESIPYILHALTINARVHRVHWFVEPYFSKIENNILRMFDNIIYHSDSHSNREHDDQTMINWWLMVINELCCVPNMFRPSMVRAKEWCQPLTSHFGEKALRSLSWFQHNFLRFLRSFLRFVGRYLFYMVDFISKSPEETVIWYI
jgi:hypothetical protein